MEEKIIFFLKGLLLTEALTHAVRSWEIFSPARNLIFLRSDFLCRLLSCFECTAFWIGSAVFAYLYYLDFPAITFIIIIQRLASLLHIFIDLVDALRAFFSNKL